MLLRFRAFAVSSFDLSSTKANLPDRRQASIGFPAAAVSPTCSMAFPRNSLSPCSVMSGVVLPTKSSRVIFSSVLPPMLPPAAATEASGTTPSGRGRPVSCCQVTEGTWGPLYLAGRPTRRLNPRKGIPFRFRPRAASSALAHSTKANFVFTRHWTTGVACGRQSPVLRIAPLKNSIIKASFVPGGVFPTKSSRFTLSIAAGFM
mmetsp:Transcript_10514/g.23200  ORF Transcript_10514/g.23200 Transcript_10514/m.23200 type:complete len:204 (-) Transcript_10514:235-846(-)